MNNEPHQLPSGNSILPSVAWDAIRSMIRQGVSDAKTDTVYLVDFDRTLTQIVSRMQAANASKDAVEIVRCGMQFRRAQLEAMAEREGRKNLVERLYREAIDEEKRKPGMN